MYLHICLECGGQRTATESVFSFHYVGPRDGLMLIRLGSNRLYLLSLLMLSCLAFTPTLR